MHALLLYESIAFLALTCLPLSPGLSDSAAHSGAHLTLTASMSLWVFVLYIPFVLWARHCLDMGFLFFNSAHVPSLSYDNGLAGALTTPLHYSCYNITYTFCLVVTSGLTS